MTARLRSISRLSCTAVLSLAVAGPLTAPAWVGAAPAASSSDNETFAQPYQGKLKTSTLVFGAPSTSSYPTMKLAAGQTVVAVGIVKNEWLKILPPEGSFSYIAKAFVQRYGSGDQGKVTHQTKTRAGSSIQNYKYVSQVQLEPKDDVTILGEEDEYFKIKPPKGVYLYISKDAAERVGPVGPAAPTGPSAAPSEGETPEVPASSEPVHHGEGIPGTPLTTVTPRGGPTTRDQVASGPSTRPAEAELLKQLQGLEAQFADASKKTLTDQPIDQLKSGYEALLAQPGLPEMAKRIVDIRLATLKVRSEAKEQAAELDKQQQEMQQRLTAQRAEKEEIEQRIKAIDIQVYAAVGTLRTSSLQVGRTTLYRLTDPQTGRTLVYVWGNDAKIPELLNQFVGVKGPMQIDPRLNLKVITPTTVEAVDPSKVNNSVAAEIIPPSLYAKGAPPTTSTAGR